jgi:hypothetical protein
MTNAIWKDWIMEERARRPARASKAHADAGTDPSD